MTGVFCVPCAEANCFRFPLAPCMRPHDCNDQRCDCWSATQTRKAVREMVRKPGVDIVYSTQLDPNDVRRHG